jgi:hypothetical protein
VRISRATTDEAKFQPPGGGDRTSGGTSRRKGRKTFLATGKPRRLNQLAVLSIHVVDGVTG